MNLQVDVSIFHKMIDMAQEHNYFDIARQEAFDKIDFLKRTHTIQERFLKRNKSWLDPFYDDDIDVDAEMAKIQDFLKLNTINETIKRRVKELKTIKMKQTWFNKWFKNLVWDKNKNIKKTQYIIHLKPRWYWASLPETIFCDTVFVTFEEGKDEPTVKVFKDMLFCIDHAETWYKEVKSKPIKRKMDMYIPTEI